MLREIICDKFKEKKIEFYDGLNVVLGDEQGSNSIGKSTFLMIIDYVYGGKDYVMKSIDIQRNVGAHIIKFSFVFKGNKYYFSRNTSDTEYVNICNDKYEVTETITLEQYTNKLKSLYEFGDKDISFRDVVGRYIRVYGKDNLNEKHPLDVVGNEKPTQAMNALLKLYDLYAAISELEDLAKRKGDELSAFKNAQKYHIISKIGARQRKANDKQIAELEEEREKITDELNNSKEFAVNATKEEGEFYTPHDVVQLIATMIEPYDGTLYDPCCGSGGMFIQSAELVKSKQGNLNGINVYGQEKEPATYRLAKMNLALRGISHNLGEEADSSFTHDLHKGLHFNYIMANPPFNLKGWYNDNLKNDGRWSDYQTPPESNANYAWILHILSHLKKTDGVAGFLLANGALNDSDTLEIRKELIQNDKIEAIVVLPRELFITTDISVTLWILNQNKKGGKYHGRNLRNREHEILFMDLRQWTENAVKGESKKKVRLDTEQIEKAADIYHTWQCEETDGAAYEIPELYRGVCINEIENKGWALTPSKYIEFIDHDLDIDYEKEMARIQSEMKEVMKQEKKSQQMLEEAFRGIGYGID